MPPCLHGPGRQESDDRLNPKFAPTFIGNLVARGRASVNVTLKTISAVFPNGKSPMSTPSVILASLNFCAAPPFFDNVPEPETSLMASSSGKVNAT